MIVANLVIGANAIASGEGGAVATVENRAPQPETLIEPADYALSIWGLIYLGLAVYSVYQALPAQRDNPVTARVGWWYIPNAVANGLWILAALNNQLALTAVLIWVILLTLMVIVVRVGLGAALPRGRDYWLVAFPFHIYFGWIALATIVNTASFLRVDLGLENLLLSAEAWTIVLLSVAFVIGVVMTLRWSAIPFGFVVAWGLGSIAVANAQVSSVALVATVTSLSILAISVFALIRATQGRGGGRTQMQRA
jgi:hypothetical protein